MVRRVTTCVVAVGVLLSAWACQAVVQPDLPAATTAAGGDPCHAGTAVLCVLNPAVTQATIAATICVRGWTATIRPPATYTEELKRQQMRQFNLAGSLSAYEEDHRMPLELGGAPKDPMNLSPESPASPNPKDHDEDTLREQVCSGQLTLLSAQATLAGRWLGPYPTYRSG